MVGQRDLNPDHLNPAVRHPRRTDVEMLEPLIETEAFAEVAIRGDAGSG